MEGQKEQRFQAGKKVMAVSLFGNTLLAILKLLSGFLAGSAAMLADGVHSLSDIFSTLVVLVSMKISVKPADQTHPYGHGKAESIGAKILAITLIITGLALAWDGIQSLMAGETKTPGILALYAAVLSILFKEGMFQYASRVGKRISSTALMADAWHHRSDALSSLAALMGIGAARLGYPFMDPLASVLVAGMIVRIGYKLVTKAIDELMDRAPDEGIQEKMASVAESCGGVKRVGDLKVRFNGPDLYVDMSLVVERGMSAYEAHEVSVKVKDAIMAKDKRVQDVLIHVDPAEIEQR